jgi:hypothetical protein
MSRLVIYNKVTTDRPACMKYTKLFETTMSSQSIISAGIK